jgi:hypothetical protein
MGGMTLPIPCTAFIAASPPNTARRLVMLLDEMFLQWWAESYPTAKPATHTVATHVAFAQHVLDQQMKVLLEQVRKPEGS